jgi:hypothetical protein
MMAPAGRLTPNVFTSIYLDIYAASMLNLVLQWLPRMATLFFDLEIYPQKISKKALTLH